MELLKQTQSFFDMLDTNYRSGVMVYMTDSKSVGLKSLRVRVPPSVLNHLVVLEKSNYWVRYKIITIIANRAIV